VKLDRDHHECQFRRLDGILGRSTANDGVIGSRRRPNELDHFRRRVDSQAEKEWRQMRIDYRELKSRICLQELLERIGWKGDKGRGDQLRGPCPLPACQSKVSSAGSNRKDRSFSIHASKNIYRCFRCGSAENALDFWQAYRAMTLYEAAKELIQNHETSNCTLRSSQPAKQQSPISQPAKLAGS